MTDMFYGKRCIDKECEYENLNEELFEINMAGKKCDSPCPKCGSTMQYFFIRYKPRQVLTFDGPVG